MEFVDREKELENLARLFKLSGRKAFLVGIFGLRRVGKTTLINHFRKGKNSLYFFVNESKTSADLLAEYMDELRKAGILSPIEKPENWDTFVGILFERCRNMVIVFDEFQNFHSVEPAIFSIFQKLYDSHEGTPIMIVFLGSLIGLFKNIFEDKKKPLYGRLKTKIKLMPLSFPDTAEMLRLLGHNNTEDLVLFYSIFSGFPKYYVAMDDFGLQKKVLSDVLSSLFLEEGAPLKDEVEDILRQEFGRRKSLYYSILHAIASGKTKISEIASAVGLKESSISRHLDELVNYFEFVRKDSTVLEENKKTIYSISHPLISFWFRYIYRNYSEYKIGSFENIKSIIKSDLNSFVGKRFESVAREFVVAADSQNLLPLALTKTGPWWGYRRVLSSQSVPERREIEIDLVCLDENRREALFIECKWAALKEMEARKILEELKEKARFVDWTRKKEYFGLIAKKIEGKARLRKEGFVAFDLADFEKFLR